MKAIKKSEFRSESEKYLGYLQIFWLANAFKHMR